MNTKRRAFLRALSGSAATVGLPLLLAACGGGGGDGPAADPDSGSGSGGGGNSGGSVDAAARVAAIRGVEEQCRALAQRQLAPAAFVDALAAHLRRQPIYAAVGADHAGQCAWGEFADGRVHLIALNPPPRRAPASAERAYRMAAAAAPVEVPGSKAARVMQAFGPEFDTADVVTDLSAWLGDKGYTMSAITPHTAHVSALRAVQGDGYFYLNAHGGAFAPVLTPSSEQVMYSVQSSTLVSAAQEEQPEMRADLDARRLTYFTATNGETILGGLFDDWDTRYGVTAKFVDAYWKFAADSVVVMNACSSARTSDARWAVGFVAACHRAGAAVYFGWDGTVTPTGAFRATRYLTDRLVGANRFQPESPKQRPFPWDAVMGDVGKKTLDVDPGSQSRFVALPRLPRSHVQELAPSIHHVEVDEYKDRLKLHGLFGRTMGKVTVDQVALKIVEWKPERIVCELPRTGSGSAGPVRVEVRGLKSNWRQLSEWTLKLDYTWKLLEAQGLKVTGLGSIRLRADVGPTREAPGEVPAQATRHTIATRESNLPMVASGAFPTPKCTLVWTGSATYEAIPMPGDDDQLVAYLALDTKTRHGSLGLGIGSMVPDFTQSGCGDPTKFQAIFGVLDEQIMYPSPVEGSTDLIPLHALALSFGADWRIAPGRFENPMVRLVWGEVLPRFAPTAEDGA
ncbi:IPT/TIG domain-containing protein [Variovorax sp. YR752]|uniref:IPT/TIG domain-containing protein n=1 Tax=Variovorax sp. YR752 TaxID=1884383 RepID=UPI003137E5DC